MDPLENLPDDCDPTVLEVVRAWIHDQFRVRKAEADSAQTQTCEDTIGVKPIFWIGTLLLACGQVLLGMESQRLPLAGLLVLGGGAACLWFGRSGEEAEPERTAPAAIGEVRFAWKPIWFSASLVMAAVCFLLFTENRFGWLATLSWLVSIACGIYAFWSDSETDGKLILKQKIREKWRKDRLFLGLAALVVVCGSFFRMKDLAGVPPEVISAQVESYYSVSEIKQGANHVLFSRNAVPEPLNYYWAYLVNLLSGKPLTMRNLRLANALAGLIGLAFLYGLGKTTANRWVGLAAAGLAGMSFWLSLQERAAIGGALVFPLMAAALYGLIKALDGQDGRFFLLSSVAFGLGLMSNKIFLIFPLAAAVVILCWRGSVKPIPAGRIWALLGIGLFLTALTAMPLIRAVSLEPAAYFAPILARIGQSEQAYPGNPLIIFLTNFAQALGIANWSSHGSWVDSLPNRAVVDGLTALFFLFGLLRAAGRWRTGRDWRLLSMLALYPVLLLPSALALAFPAENPSPTRAVGAAIPVFLIAAYGALELFKLLKGAFRRQSPALVAGLIAFLLGSAAVWNYDLIFRQYAERYKQSAWNASEIAEVIQRFFSNGKEGISYLISYPYWVDSRAVTISMGQPGQNLSLPSSEIASTSSVTLPKLFILNPMDKESIAKLQSVYPEAVISIFQSANPDKNFILFIVGQ